MVKMTALQDHVFTKKPEYTTKIQPFVIFDFSSEYTRSSPQGDLDLRNNPYTV